MRWGTTQSVPSNEANADGVVNAAYLPGSIDFFKSRTVCRVVEYSAF